MFKNNNIKFIITNDYFIRSLKISKQLKREIKNKTLLVKEISPIKKGYNEEPVFDKLDAFYLPLANFKMIQRPGPVIKIYKIL